MPKVRYTFSAVAEHNLNLANYSEEDGTPMTLEEAVEYYKTALLEFPFYFIEEGKWNLTAEILEENNG